MRIATWNINSVRLRLHNVRQAMKDLSPDILCLQETKVDDPLFPLADIQKLGFPHVYFAGQKSYNGVAILSKLPLKNMANEKMCGRDDKRHISAILPDGTELHNFYVPAGGDIPDPALNDKFAHKLQFMEELALWADKRAQKNRRLILVGDINIAPLPTDVWSHKQLLSVVSHTPVEVAAMEKLRDSAGWVDSVRHFVPAEEKIYSWWSYRNKDWKKSDRGRRLDHIWVTPNLVGSLQTAHIHKPARDWRLPSDHVPVIVDLTMEGGL